MTLDHIPKNLHKTVPDRPDTRAAPSYRWQDSHKTWSKITLITDVCL